MTLARNAYFETNSHNSSKKNIIFIALFWENHQKPSGLWTNHHTPGYLTMFTMSNIYKKVIFIPYYMSMANVRPIKCVVVQKTAFLLLRKPKKPKNGFTAVSKRFINKPTSDLKSATQS